MNPYIIGGLVLLALLAGGAYLAWVILSKNPERETPHTATHPTPAATPAGGGGHGAHGNDDHGHGHGGKKMGWWLKLPLSIIFIAAAFWGAAWLWHHLPAEAKAVPRVRDTSVVAGGSTSTTLAALRCQGTDKVIATIGPGKSVLVSLDEGVTMDTFPSDPNLVISAADDPNLSTSNGGTLDAPSHFFRVRNTRAKGGAAFYFGCAYR
jgi:hypothetical protein